MSYKVFLNSQFEEVEEKDAELVKVVDNKGVVKFYRPNKQSNTQKAEGKWVTVGGHHFQIGGSKDEFSGSSHTPQNQKQLHATVKEIARSLNIPAPERKDSGGRLTGTLAANTAIKIRKFGDDAIAIDWQKTRSKDSSAEVKQFSDKLEEALGHVENIVLEHFNDPFSGRVLAGVRLADNSQKAFLVASDVWGDVRDLTDIEMQVLSLVDETDINFILANAATDAQPFLNTD